MKQRRQQSQQPVADDKLLTLWCPAVLCSRSRGLGLDGLAMLVLSTLIIVATVGLSWLWQLLRVYRIARFTPSTAVPCGLIVVLGSRLRNDAISQDYAKRLRKARELYEQGCSRQILILGGKTGNSRNSEADQGRRFLSAQGVPEHSILIEDTSLHTLENLRHARATLNDPSTSPFAMITSRYHLARSQWLAVGLNLQPVLCAAEERLSCDTATVLRLIQEAYYLHWYVVGKAWSQWTGNKKSLGKIT